MTRYFDRKGKPLKLMEWAKLFENVDYKIVQRDVLLNGTLVSTVWLGIDHSFFGNGPPLIFETMVFLDGKVGMEEDMDRYSTEEEARTGHKAMVAKWKAKSK
jgi:hypothetical protein